MATKIICDKCGTEIKKNIYRCKFEKEMTEGVASYGNSTELCENCFNQLLDFIQNRPSSVSGLTWGMR